MAREYFNAYHSYLKAIEPLNDAERGRLFTACLEYSETGIGPELRGNERFVFPSIQSQIDRDIAKYDAFVAKQSENGKKGGRPPKANASQETQAFSGKAKKAKEKEKEKEKEKARETISPSGEYCAEPQAASAPPAATLPLNTGEEYPIFRAQIDEWAALYPAVDVEQELRNMRGWCSGNPTRRKTASGITRFITGWLAKEQNKGGTRRPAGHASAQASGGNPFLRRVREMEENGQI